MITTLPAAPTVADSTSEFNAKAFAMVGALPGLVSDINAVIPTVNQSLTASAAALAAANFKGDWSTLSGALSIPASVSYGGNVWLLIANTSNVASDTPGVSSKWLLYSSFNNVLLNGIREKITIAATAATGTVNFDTITQSVTYLTANAAANWTVNFRGDSGNTLNSQLAIGETKTVTMMVKQGTTAYFNSAFQVDGASVTPLWLNGATPTYGNPSSLDAYTFAIIKTANAAFTVLASQSRYA